MEKGEMIPVNEFCSYYNIEINFVQSLHDAGLVSITSSENEIYLDHEQLSKLEKFIRLHHDLDINMEGIEAISHILQRMKAMQQEIARLKSRLGIYEQ